MKRILVFMVLCLSISVVKSQLPHVASGHLRRFTNFPSQYVDARNVDVWLPDGYDGKKQFSVLYMHDGQMLFDSLTTWNKQDWGIDETMSALMQQQQIKNCIVVGVFNSGANRHIDYFPQKPFESLTKAQQDSLLKANRNNGAGVFAGKIQSDMYLKFLVKELKPFIDKTFSTLQNQHNTFIAGSSMGGLISMYAICEYPKVFGGAACISTHWPGTFAVENNPIPTAFLQYLKTHLPSPVSHKIYFDYGTETLDALYEPFQLQADAIMKAKGYTSKNWITRKFEGENHSEVAWRKRFSIPAIFLLGK
ncbi:MAG: alpha/beta hydrolase [Ferruginibacter sp.]